MGAELFSERFAGSGVPTAWAVTPTEGLRWVLVWSISSLALAGLCERRMRQQVAGLLFRKELTVLLVGVYFLVTVGVAYQYPQWWEQWWTYVVPGSTLLLGVVFWLPLQGARLSWHGAWDFRYPLATPDGEGLEQERHRETLSPVRSTPRERRPSVPRETRLRLLTLLLVLVGLACALIPLLVVNAPHRYPDWLASNAFLWGVTGLFTIGYGRKTLRLACKREDDGFPSFPARKGAWVGFVLWPAACLCCLAGLALTLGAMTVMMNPGGHTSGALFLAFPLMPAGGLLFARGRKTFLRARRHRARVIPGPEVLKPGSYVLYLRPFEDDRRRTALHEVPLPGAVGGVMGFAMSRRSAEEHITDALRPVGPLIAVGEPGETLPHVGAARMELPVEPRNAWRAPVHRLMRRSRLTVLTLGTSESALWELKEALSVLPPQRLVLFLPPMENATYARIRAAADAWALQEPAAPSGTRGAARVPAARLPARPGRLSTDDCEPVQGIVRFAPDGTPAFAHVRASHNEPTRNLFTALLPGLAPAFAVLMEYEEQTGRHCC
ncbi:hypothetical protein [Streptomyces sp. NPDC052496]|uniref:hypothetical protein n=1 Tax=Streptomyces sp. NPDC052496 TaxID=3154951 RepID=UPI0034130DEA